MAKSALRIRFSFNAQGGTTKSGFQSSNASARQRYLYRFAQAVVKNITFQYAEDEYKKLAGKIESTMAYDIQRELVHMTALFRAHITGSNGGTNSPAGSLTSLSGAARYESLPIKTLIPEWAPRVPSYLRYKQRKTGNRQWFTARGLSAKKDAAYSGLKINTTAKLWTDAFGPIKVNFFKSAASSEAASTKVDGQHVRVAVGTLKVYALTNITPEMLPALASGDARTKYSANGNPGLMGLVRNVDPQMAYRLDRRSQSGRYRPTLEPFLSYFLTAAVPAAVSTRLYKSVFGGGAVGRTR